LLMTYLEYKAFEIGFSEVEVNLTLRMNVTVNTTTTSTVYILCTIDCYFFFTQEGYTQPYR
jgi:hypothetical protein